MYRTVKIPFQTSKKDIDRLFECNRISAQIWNDCLVIAKNYALKNNGKWINQTELQKQTKGKYPIHSQSIQAVCHKYLNARDSAKKAKQKGLDNKYPYKQKKYFNTKWANNGFIIHPNGTIELKMGRWERKNQPPIVVKIDKEQIPNGTVKEIELRKLMLCLSYENGEQPTTKKEGTIAAGDPGEIHAISAVSENGSSIIITGRKIRSIHRLRNKKIAELQKKMSKCKKGSRKWKKYNRAKQYILSKSEAQLKDCLHKTTKQLVDWCLEQNVKHFMIGDVEGVQRNKKKKRSKLVNQKLSNWCFGKLYDYLKYKLEAKGITFEKVDESYTTQTCPVCGKKKKPSSRNFICACGYSQHRDVHSACNILTKHLYGEFRPMKITNHKYLRIA